MEAEDLLEHDVELKLSQLLGPCDSGKWNFAVDYRGYVQWCSEKERASKHKLDILESKVDSTYFSISLGDKEVQRFESLEWKEYRQHFDVIAQPFLGLSKPVESEFQ